VTLFIISTVSSIDLVALMKNVPFIPDVVILFLLIIANGFV
jgi:hypothetical protein